MSNAQIITMSLIIITIMTWILWDVRTYIINGNSTTESATIYRWAYYAPGVAVLVGILIGHFFFPQSEVIQELTRCSK
jgi:bacteriorhodopsin